MIGIFDSGYGGLTVLKEIVKRLPQYKYIYLGDNARAPYGNRTKETITRFTEEGVRFLFERGARLIILACFTASSMALKELQEKLLRNQRSPYRDKKILGVIRPIVEKAAAMTASKRIGVVGTRATVDSNAFENELKNLRHDLTVIQQACPLLVPFIEDHMHTKPEALSLLRKYLRPLKTHHIDTLILGCTHYPLMIKDFRRMMGRRVSVLNSGEIVADSLAEYLKRHPEIEMQLSKKTGVHFLTTEDSGRFAEFVKAFAGMEINAAPTQVQL